MKDAGLERVMRDLRIFRIFEGTNDILRLFVAGVGLGSAGQGLKELQQAVKNPVANLGFLASEGTNFLSHRFGLGIAPTDKLTKVRSELKSAADLIEKQTAAFGFACKELLIKYGKNIEDQQIPLRRVAESAMELYAMAAVTSRATRALNTGASSASHEVLLANTYCQEASQKISQNLKALKVNTDKKVQEIADQVFKEENYIPVHPLGL